MEEPKNGWTQSLVSSRPSRLLLVLLALLCLPVLAAPVYGADQGVEVDNSLGNGLVTGQADSQGPGSGQAHLTLTNHLNVWVAVDLKSYEGQGPTGEVSLDPQGVFAKVGLIGPDSEAAWQATFGPSSSQPIWAHIDFRTSNGSLAAVATVLSVMANAGDGLSNPATPSKLKLALTIVKESPDWLKLLDYMGRTDAAQLDLWSLTMLFTNLLRVPEARQAAFDALSAMGVADADTALKKAGQGLSLLDLGRTLYDLWRAAAGSGSGQVTFYRVAWEPETAPTTTTEAPSETSAPAGPPPSLDIPTTTTTMSAPLERDAPAGLPEAVADTWVKIWEAANNADYKTLASLALANGEFAYQGMDYFEGVAEDERGADGLEEYLRAWGDLPWLLWALQCPYVFYANGYYVWPEAYMWQLPWTAAQREWLLQYYSPDEIEYWESMDAYGAYYGYSLGISVDGDWEWFEGGYGD